MANRGIVSKLEDSRQAAAKLGADAGKAIGRTARKAKTRVQEVPPPSPNPMTNLFIADVALRGGGRLLRHLVERAMLGSKYNAHTAKSLIKGRGMRQTLLGTAVARVATGSVPGAILVGGGLLAKALYDRRRGSEAEDKGNKALARRAAKGS